MKAIIKPKPAQTKQAQRWRQSLWFVLLWSAGVVTLATLVYGLRAVLDPVLGA